MSRPTPVQIDPPGCGCTECMTGEYVPLDRATTEQVMAMLHGELGNATSEQFTLATVITDYLGGTGTITVTVTAEYHPELTWTFSRPGNL